MWDRLPRGSSLRLPSLRAKCIGIDDAFAWPYFHRMSPPDDLLDLFPAVYLRFCRRHTKDDTRLTPQMSAVLHHLAMSGPLTVGEMARHFDRAQSVVSEIALGLEEKGLLARMRDARDRRRTLVWLTDLAHEVMRREHEVLDRERVARAMAGMSEREREGLLEGMRALLRAGEARSNEPRKKRESNRRTE